MKKIFNLILASSVALGFAACNNDRAQNEPANEGTKTAVQFRVSEVKTRALNDGQADVEGQTGESAVTSGKFITPSTELALTMTGSDNDYQSEVTLYEGATGTGIKSAFFLNLPSGINANITTPEQVISIEKLKDVASKTAFTMSSATKAINIQEGIAKGDVAPNKNQFSYEVERLVSKVQVTNKKDEPTLGESLEGVGTFSEFSYAVAGGAKKLYLYGDKAGDRQLDDNGKVYKNYKSAIHGLPASTFKNGKFEVRRDLTMVSDKSLVAPFVENDAAKQFEDFASLPVRETETYKDTSDANGIFFFENSLDVDVTGKGVLNLADITYVKLYSTMAAANDKVIKTVKEDNSYEYASDVEVAAAHDEKLEVEEAYYTANKEKEGFEFELDGNYGDEGTKYYLKITNVAGTFYKGANGKLYLTLTASRADGNETSEKFVGGKMVWWVPANSQLDDTNSFTKYADTRRNNIYALNIDRITGLGHNYDPLDPTDPNAPKPGEGDNPDEPDKDEDIKVDPEETNIQVTAKILNWNLVHRGIELK